MKTILLATVFFLNVWLSHAQTITDFEAKYGKPLQIYQIRPNVLVRIKSDEKGQISEMRVEKYNASDKMIYLSATLPPALVKEIVDELAPPAKRGTRNELSGDTVLSSGASITEDDFQNVTVTYYSDTTNSPDNVVVLIKWKLLSSKQK